MKRIIVLIAILVVGISVWAALHRNANASQEIQSSGTVEARNIRVGSKVGGRVSKVLVSEGDQVKAGQVLIEFESDELNASLEQSKARLARASAELQKMKAGYQPQEVAEARASASQARYNMEEAERGNRPEQIAAAQAERDRAAADAKNAHTTLDRFEQLFRADEISRQEYDDAKSRAEQADAVLRNRSETLAELQRGTRVEEVRAAQARYEQARANAQKLERGYRSEDVKAAQADAVEADAEVHETETRLREMQVSAPSDATVEVLDVRPGDLIAPNVPVATLLERNQLYVRVYVPETRIGEVRLGQEADVFVDSFPKHAFRGQVEQINQQAEFLPRNVQTADERAHQVIGVKLRIDDPENRIRAGMAASVKLHQGSS